MTSELLELTMAFRGLSDEDDGISNPGEDEDGELEDDDDETGFGEDDSEDEAGTGVSEELLEE